MPLGSQGGCHGDPWLPWDTDEEGALGAFYRDFNKDFNRDLYINLDFNRVLIMILNK